MVWRLCGRSRPKADQALLDCLSDLANESKISDPETCWFASKAGMSDDGSGEGTSAFAKNALHKIISTVPASHSLFSQSTKKHFIVHHSSTALCCRVLCMARDFPRSLALVILVCQRGGACSYDGRVLPLCIAPRLVRRCFAIFRHPRSQRSNEMALRMMYEFCLNISTAIGADTITCNPCGSD